MKFVTVQFKKKFQTEYNSDEYSYKCSDTLNVSAGDIVVVDTMYGLELARVCRVPATKHHESRATRWVRCVLMLNDDKPVKPDAVEPPEEIKSEEIDTSGDGFNW